MLGRKDPAKLQTGLDAGNKIPLWDNNHKAVLRIRIQSKGVTKAAANEKRQGWPSSGAQGYQITMEIQFKNVSKSMYNIGPIVGKSANIDAGAIKLP